MCFESESDKLDLSQFGSVYAKIYNHYAQTLLVNKSDVIAVAGPAGVGKTTWLRQHFLQERPLYFCPGVQPVPIDLTYVKAEFPTVEVLTNGQESQLFAAVGSSPILIEIGFQLDLGMITPLLDALAAERVAIVPSKSERTVWHDWAQRVEVGVNLPAIAMPPQTGIADQAQLWRAALTGRVFELASLEMFWFELTAGAYGQVDRVKGIFDLSDGLQSHFDFVQGVPNRFTQVPVARWLQGRPQRFSGIEVVGHGLELEAIARTLHDCCLNDQAIAHYQAQLLDSVHLAGTKLAANIPPESLSSSLFAN
jgi:Cobalamin synthesis protein cobW C-terminal domain